MQPLHLLPLLGLAGVLAGQNPAHSVAIVNDPKSHGQIGDKLLSLREVLLLNMGKLKETQLSADERKQLTGFGDDIAWGDIDTKAVPLLTFERDLPVLQNTPHGLVIAGSNGTPTIDIRSTKGFVSTSSFVDFRNLRIRGGRTAITLTQNDSPYGTVLENVTFEGQTEAALVVNYVNPVGKTRGEGRLQIEKCRFPGIPRAVQLTTLDVNRTDTLIVSDSDFSTAQIGIAVRLGNTGTLSALFERSRFDKVERAIEITHANASDAREIVLETAGVRISGAKVGFRYDGKATAKSSLDLRMVDIAATQQSIAVGPLGNEPKVTLDDSRVSGTVEMLAGKSHPLTVGNTHFTGAKVAVGTSGGPVRVLGSFLDRTTFEARGPTAVRIEGSRFATGSVRGLPAAPVSITQSFLGGVQLGSQVTASNSLAAPQLGSMEVTPLDPPIGTTMTLKSDLPPKLSGIWVIGEPARTPTIGPRPFHFYFDTFFYVTMPGAVRGQSQRPVGVPNNLWFRGRHLAIQLVVLPDPGFNAPAIALPPGRFVRFR